MITRSLLSSLVPLLLAATPTPALALGDVTLGPDQDTTIYSEDDLSNALHSGVFAGRTNEGNNRRALLRFDVAGAVPAGATITSAELVLRSTASPFGGASTTIAIHRLTDAWGEGTSSSEPSPGGLGAPATPGDATWQDRVFPTTPWSTPGGDFVPLASASTVVPAVLSAYTWSSPGVIADVQAWLDAPATNHGWIVIGDESFNRTARRFGSREFPDPNFRPRLVIGFELDNSFCDDADGSLASCPCANPGLPDSGCEISQGTGGVRLDVVAQQTSPLNRLTLGGSGFPPSAAPSVIVIRAPALDPSAPVVFGDGLRCVGVPLVRLGAAFANGGTSVHTLGHGAMAGTGDVFYQLWFRNTPGMYCTPDAFNLSNGRTITW